MPRDRMMRQLGHEVKESLDHFLNDYFKRTDLRTDVGVSHLKGSCLQQHDLIMLTQGLKPWNALGKFNHFFNSWSEALRETLPDLLTGVTGWGDGICIERTCLEKYRKRPFKL